MHLMAGKRHRWHGARCGGRVGGCPGHAKGHQVVLQRQSRPQTRRCTPMAVLTLAGRDREALVGGKPNRPVEPVAVMVLFPQGRQADVGGRRPDIECVGWLSP